jgi:hypothetical protein
MIDLKICINSKNGPKQISPQARTKYLPPAKPFEPSGIAARGRPEGIRISLSLSAQAFESAHLLSEGSKYQPNASLIGRGPLQEIKSRLLEQLSSSGEDAELLSEVPDSQDPARLELARQAIDFALTEKSNPFSDLSREQLSHIAYEDTGAFTSAERFAAFEEIDKRDSDYYRSILEQAQYETTIGNIQDSTLFLIRAKYPVSQSMSEAERLANGELSEDALKSMLDLAQAQGVTLPKQNIDYANLLSEKDQMVVSSIDDQGGARWQNLSIKDLIPESEGNTNLDMAVFLKNMRSSDNQSTPYVNSAWITLYQRNDRFK